MAKTFEEQIHMYGVEMAHMVYSKYVVDAYAIQACSTDYNRALMDSKKLRMDFAMNGTACDKLSVCVPSYSKNKINCYPVCKPVETTEPTVESDKVCHQLFIQSTPSTTWTISLELDFMPNVTTVAMIGGSEVEIKGAVSYDESNKKIIIEFSSAVAGKAFLS